MVKFLSHCPLASIVSDKVMVIQIIVPLLMCHYSHAALRFLSLILVFSLSMTFLCIYPLWVFCVSQIYTCKGFTKNWEISAIISSHMSSSLVFLSFCDSNYTYARPLMLFHMSPRQLFYCVFLPFPFSSSVCVTSVDLSSSSLTLPFVISILWFSPSGEFLFRIFFFSSVLEFPFGFFQKFYFSAKISYIIIHYEYPFFCITEHSYNSYFKDFEC